VPREQEASYPRYLRHFAVCQLTTLVKKDPRGIDAVPDCGNPSPGTTVALRSRHGSFRMTSKEGPQSRRGVQGGAGRIALK